MGSSDSLVVITGPVAYVITGQVAYVIQIGCPVVTGLVISNQLIGCQLRPEPNVLPSPDHVLSAWVALKFPIPP